MRVERKTAYWHGGGGKDALYRCYPPYRANNMDGLIELVSGQLSATPRNSDRVV